MPEHRGPHQAITAANGRERFTLDLLDALWDQYRQRVSYVGQYEQVVQAAGATFVNDHIAFRTFASQRPMTGIATLSRLFEALDYRAAGVYHFPDKHLSAVHLQHPQPDFPKLFISELKTWELTGPSRDLIESVVAAHRPAVPLQTLVALSALDREASRAAELQTELVRYFHELPWPPPSKQAVVQVNAESQYAAWVLLHGYNVNHFTSLVNSHGVESLNDLDKTIAALRAAGVPMKAEIEGEPGSKLRQTATEAVQIEVTATDKGRPIRMPWSYAYFELAERNPVRDPTTGELTRFEGFLGAQATNLFEMTKVALQKT